MSIGLFLFLSVFKIIFDKFFNTLNKFIFKYICLKPNNNNNKPQPQPLELELDKDSVLVVDLAVLDVRVVMIDVKVERMVLDVVLVVEMVKLVVQEDPEDQDVDKKRSGFH